MKNCEDYRLYSGENTRILMNNDFYEAIKMITLERLHFEAFDFFKETFF